MRIGCRVAPSRSRLIDDDNAAMLDFFRPPPDVSHWIEGGVVVRLGPAAGVSCFPAMPHAMLTMRLMRLSGHAASALCPPITFHALSTVPVVHPHAGDLVALGLLVRPAAAACLLGAAGAVVTNQVLPWSALAGANEAARLEEEIDGSTNDTARLRALTASLRRTMARVSQQRDLVYAHLCDAVGLHGAQAGDHLGLGRRHLERRCRAVLGLAPKQFHRLTRFHRALSAAVAGGASALAEIAVDAGFYDQSHMARDARLLAGEPLRALVSAAQPQSPWWPLAARRSVQPPNAIA